MKKQALMILTTLSFVVMLTATATYAQSSTVQLANIPFEFVIGNKAFPAGEYTFTCRYTGLIQIQSQARGESGFVLTGPVDARKARNELVFNRYGDQYFLSTLWTEGDQVGRAVRKSRSERELIQARSLVAKSSSEPQMVSITLVANKR